MKEDQDQGKGFHFPAGRLGLAVVCFVAFLVAGLGVYYNAVGEFVSGELASLYALLALVGAAAVLLHLWWFAVPYYIGCAAAWVCGSYVGGLKGDFAPTAGGYTAAFLIAVSALFGLILQWRALRRKYLRRKEEKAKAEAEVKAAEIQKETAAELTAAAATPEQPEKGSEGTKGGPGETGTAS